MEKRFLRNRAAGKLWWMGHLSTRAKRGPWSQHPAGASAAAGACLANIVVEQPTTTTTTIAFSPPPSLDVSASRAIRLLPATMGQPVVQTIHRDPALLYVLVLWEEME